MIGGDEGRENGIGEEDFFSKEIWRREVYKEVLR